VENVDELSRLQKTVGLSHLVRSCVDRQSRPPTGCTLPIAGEA